MDGLFLHLLNMSITAGWLVLAVMVLRFLLKKAPRWITVALWGAVALRLLLPVSFESVLSLVPSAQTVPIDIGISQSPAIDSGIPLLNSVVNPILTETLAPDLGESVNPLQILTVAATAVWVCGMVAMGVYALFSTLRLRRKVGEAARLRENVWACDAIDTPFILGVFRPRIYLPSRLSETDAAFVLAHERAHLKRRDHWWKPLGFVLLTVYWFNPLLWVAYILLCRDIESACDEKVLAEQGSEIKKPYSEALIHCSIPRKIISACPLAFGEVGVKDRVKSVLNYKKPAFWVILTALLACAVLSVCFLTDPPQEESFPAPGYVLLKNAEDLTLETTLDNTVEVMIGDGEAYKTVIALPSAYLARLGNLEISAAPLSQSRSEDRFRDHTLVLQTAEDRISPQSSRIFGTYVCFNGDFSEVWLTGNLVKPTLTYGVKDPQTAKAIWEDIYGWYNGVSPNGGATPPQNTTVTVNVNLRALYPQYFDLPTDKGLTVYVWQFSPTIYQYGLLAGPSSEHTLVEQLKMEPVLLPHMRAIVESYGLDREDISVVPILHPLSSYFYPIDEAYQADMEALFWTGISSEDYRYAEKIFDSARCDMDGDGEIETVLLLPGPTSGLLSYALAVVKNPTEDLKRPLERYTVFYPEGGTGWEAYFSLEETDDGRCVLKGLNAKEEKDVYYSLSYDGEHILCTKIED